MLAEWLGRRTSRAPAALAARVVELAGAAPPGPAPADTLARAAGEALGRVTASAGDRSVALDLLAADALITLALLFQAEADPGRLGEFARSLLPPGVPGSGPGT